MTVHRDPALPVLRFGIRLSPHAAEAGRPRYLLEVWPHGKPEHGQLRVSLQEMSGDEPGRLIP